MPVDIRPYQAKDFLAVAELFDNFQKYLSHVDDKHMLQWKDGYGEEYVKLTLEHIEKRGGIFVVSENDGAIIGLCAGEIIESEPIDEYEVKPHKAGRITEIYVEGEYRGQGIGKQLLERVEEYFREQKCEVIRLEVFAPNASARAFYDKMGYGERDIDLAKFL